MRARIVALLGALLFVLSPSDGVLTVARVDVFDWRGASFRWKSDFVGTILFVAELGSGFGHVRRLLPLARAAARDGFRALFLVANPQEVRAMVREAGFEVQPAPRVRQPHVARQPGEVARSFGDILGGLGFGDVAFLEQAAAAWHARLGELAPVAIVCEMSPFLCLATHGRGIPVLVTGYGFILPPPHLQRFPPLLCGPPLFAEETLLDAVATVLRHGATQPPLGMPALLAGTSHAVTGLDLLDPYRGVRAEPAIGPPDLEVRPIDTEPSDDFFAYLLGDAPMTATLLAALARSGRRGRVFVRRARAEHQRIIANNGRVEWLDQPASIASALARARVVIHHGSMLTAEEALASGRPQVIAPLYLEHLVTARALATLGVAAVVQPRSQIEAITATVDVGCDRLSQRRTAYDLAMRINEQRNATHRHLPATIMSGIALGE